MQGRRDVGFLIGRSAIWALVALSLAACSVGGKPTSLELLLASEKAAFKRHLAKEKKQIQLGLARSINSSPEELNQAFGSSPEVEIVSASHIAKGVVAKVGESKDTAMVKQLEKMLKRLTSDLELKDYKYSVTLLDDDAVNAFTPGAGKILLNEGLLIYCDTEGQVAAVMAHEIAHILMKHPRRMRQYSIARKAGDSFMDKFMPKALEDNIGKLLRLGGKATINSFVRAQEAEADSIAIDILVAAGYDPRAMIDVQRILRQYSPQMSRLANMIYGNHPLSKDREEAARKKIEELYPEARGIVSTPAYDELAEKYKNRRPSRLALWQ